MLKLCALIAVLAAVGRAEEDDKSISTTEFTTTTVNTATLFRNIEDRLRDAEKTLDTRASAEDVMKYQKKISDLTTEIKSLLASSEQKMEKNMQSVFSTSIDSVTKSVSASTQALSSNIEGRIRTVDTKIGTVRSNLVSAVNAKVSEAENKVSGDLDNMKTTLEKQLDGIKAQSAAAKETADASLAASQKSLDDKIANLDVTSSVDALLAKADKDLAEAGKKVDAAAYPKKIMWSGGCNHHGHSDGWKPYCHGVTEWNTAQEFLTLNGGQSNSQFVVKKTGWYRINWWGSGQRHWNQVGIWRNGGHIHHGHEYTDGNWHDHYCDLTWKFNKGDSFWVQIYGTGHGHWNYHSWNSGGAHSRMQVEYLGIA